MIEHSEQDNAVTGKLWKMVLAHAQKSVIRNTGFHNKEDAEDIAAYAVELAWVDWDPSHGIPFERFIWNKINGSYLYFQKAIQRHVAERSLKKKRWYSEESYVWMGADGKEHNIIEDFADPDNLEPCPVEEIDMTYHVVIDASEFAAWMISEINEYIEHLMAVCDCDKIYALHALVKSGMSLKDVARRKGLSHQNMTPVVSKICDDLAKRMHIPRNKVRAGLRVIRNEPMLSSQINIQLEMNA